MDSNSNLPLADVDIDYRSEVTRCYMVSPHSWKQPDSRSFQASSGPASSTDNASMTLLNPESASRIHSSSNLPHISSPTVATRQLAQGISALTVSHREVSVALTCLSSSVLTSLIFSRWQLRDDQATSQPEASAATTSGTNPEQRLHSNRRGRLPPFAFRQNSKLSERFLILRRLATNYNLRDRDLVLGWPAPSHDTVKPLLKRYCKKYNIQGLHGYLESFSLLLQQRLHCFEISVQRCLLRDATNVDPDGPEVEQSFQCIAIATTYQGQHRKPARVTEDQFRWLVEYFGGIPRWYWYCIPKHVDYY